MRNNKKSIKEKMSKWKRDEMDGWKRMYENTFIHAGNGS